MPLLFWVSFSTFPEIYNWQTFQDTNGSWVISEYVRSPHGPLIRLDMGELSPTSWRHQVRQWNIQLRKSEFFNQRALKLDNLQINSNFNYVSWIQVSTAWLSCESTTPGKNSSRWSRVVTFCGSRGGTVPAKAQSYVTTSPTISTPSRAAAGRTPRWLDVWTKLTSLQSNYVETNVLRAAFTSVSCARSFLCLHLSFVLYWRKTTGVRLLS